MKHFEVETTFEPIYTKAERGMKFKSSAKKERADLRDAVWQYLVDHSVLSPGGYSIKFTIKDKQTFFERVGSREHGFSKTDAEKMAAKVDLLFRGKELSDIRSLVSNLARDTFPYSLLLKFKKFTNDRINKILERRFIKAARKKYYKGRETIYDTCA